MRFTYHKPHRLRVNNSMSFSRCLHQGDHDPKPGTDTSIFVSCCSPWPPPALSPGDHSSAFCQGGGDQLAFPRVLYKQNQTACTLLCRTPFTLIDVLGIRPCRYIRQQAVPLRCRLVFHSTPFIYHSCISLLIYSPIIQTLAYLFIIYYFFIHSFIPQNIYCLPTPC